MTYQPKKETGLMLEARSPLMTRCGSRGTWRDSSRVRAPGQDLNMQLIKTTI